MRLGGIVLAAGLLSGCVPHFVRKGMDSDLRVGLLRDGSGHFGGEDLLRLFTRYEDPDWNRPLPHFKSVVQRSSLEKTRDCDLMVRLCFTGTGPEDVIRAEVHSAFTLEKIATVESTVEEEFPPGFGGIGLRVLEAFRPDSKLYARIITERMGCPANHLRGPAAGTLQLQGITHTLRRDSITEESPGEIPAWYLIPQGERAKHWVILRSGNRLTRIRAMPENTLLAQLSPGGEPDEEARVRELFWQLARSRAWERAGDLRLSAKAALEAKIAAADAWEKGWRDAGRSATLPQKLAGVFGEILRTPGAPEPAKRYACRALLRLPPEPQGTVAEQARYSLDRACAYYFAGCPPRSAESLRNAGFGPDAAGLRELLRILGTDAFAPLQGGLPEFAGYRVSGWRCSSAPADPALPRLLLCLVFEGPDVLHTYSLTRRPLGDRARHYLHRTGFDGESLVGMFGEEAPPDAGVLERIAADLPRREDVPVPVAAAREEGPALPGTATLEIEGGSGAMGTTIELRKGSRLLAGLWFEPDPRKPLREIAVPAGAYQVLIETAGRKIVRDLTLELKGRSRLPLETP